MQFHYNIRRVYFTSTRACTVFTPSLVASSRYYNNMRRATNHAFMVILCVVFLR